MDGTKPFPFTTLPGVKRDGTEFDGNFHIDAQHCRWKEGRARKMGGYRVISSQFNGPLRTVFTDSKNDYVTVHAASATAFQVITLTPAGFGAGVSDRTPTATSFVASANNLWGIQSQYNSSTATSVLTGALIFGHPGQNLSEIANDTPVNVYYGDADDTTALALATDIPAVSGGIAVVHPYLFVYGSNGYVAWSDTGQPTSFTATSGDSGDARIDFTKVVYGAPVRGGGQSPAALFWTLKKLVRATYVGGTNIFRFDDISAQTSIMSSRCVIEYDGVFYWIGLDRFQVYNGVVQELENNQNSDWFFNNVNLNYRQKIWATKVPRYGEIWWFFPFGPDATECTHAIIYNIREKTWYDTRMSRAGGYFTQDFLYPLWGGNEPLTATNESTYPLWAHEFGFDEVNGSQALAIQSYFKKSAIAFAAEGPGGQGSWTGDDKMVRVNRLELDFVQSGNMTVTIAGKAFARSDENGEAYEFTATTTKVDGRKQYRELTFAFESNDLGGNYIEGLNLIHLEPGDARP